MNLVRPPLCVVTVSAWYMVSTHTPLAALTSEVEGKHRISTKTMGEPHLKLTRRRKEKDSKERVMTVD